MNQSKAGKKLNPIIARETAPIYARNPRRYQRLCLWVWHQQRIGWPDEAIADALSAAAPWIDGAKDWWLYLTFLLPKAKGQATEAESTQHKAGDGALAAEFVEFLKQKRKSGQG